MDQEGYSGPMRKMLAGVEQEGDVARVHYALPIGDRITGLDDAIGRTFTLRHNDVLTCVSCGRRVKKFYGQGFCYPCLRDAPEASECIVRPELCRAHLGEGRSVEWEREHHDQEHSVYLSLTGGIKVGVTRSTQIPVRWIDQGAVMAVEIARTPYRQLAGLIEVQLKKQLADRTNWRKMLGNVLPDPEALLKARGAALDALTYELGAYALPDVPPLTLSYPMLAYPVKITSVNLGKVGEVSGTLLGIKGQYLVWEDGRVLNVRNHSGFHVELA